MATGYQTIYLNQGETFTTSLTLDDENGSSYNLSGFSVKCHAKKSYYAQNATIVFDTTISDANTGTITISANSAVTSNLSAGTLVYDAIIVQDDTGIVTRVLEGQIIVSPAVTFY